MGERVRPLRLPGWPGCSLLPVKVAVGIISCDVTFSYFCAYSAHWRVGDDTWGVAPGSILLRLQRALIAGGLALALMCSPRKLRPRPLQVL